MLNQMVPDPLSLPKLTPLIITQATITESTEETASHPDASQPPEDRTQDDVKLSGPVTIPSDKVSCLVEGGKVADTASYSSQSMRDR